MTRKAMLLPLAVLALISAAQNVSATSDSGKADLSGEAAVVERQDTRVHFESDGTGWRETSATVHIQSEAGVEEYGQLVLGYSSATEALEINYVRVRKPNGQVVETPPETTQDFAPEVLQSAPMYSDYREKHVTVAGLRPGDRLEFKSTTRTTAALAPGQFWFEYSFPAGIAAGEVRLELEVPKARELKIKSPKKKYTVADSGEFRTYSWVVNDIRPERKTLREREKEAEAALDRDPSEDWPDVQATTFADWASVGRWYAKLQSERALPDDAVRKKAEEVTRGAVTPQDKARRIYDYVAKEFRYVSLSFGVGRMQPHFAKEVLAGGYGDCKDKHTLLQAMLAAVHIPSYPVLIGSERRLDPDIPSPAQFDHVITLAQVGGQTEWLDTTEEIAPYDFLMYPLRNKQALVAATDGNEGLRLTEMAPPVKNTMVYSVTGKVSPAGTLDAQIEMTANGDSALTFRMIYRGTAQADWQRMAQALSAASRDATLSDFTVSDLEDTSKPLRIRFHLRQERYINVPTAGQTFQPFPPLRFPPLRRGSSPELIAVGPRADLTQRMQLEIPANITLHLPPEVVVAPDFGGEFSARFTMTGHVLQAEQHLVLKVDEAPKALRSQVESLRSVAGNGAAQMLTCDAAPVSASASASTAAGGGTARDLQTAGEEALHRSDFANAAQFLQNAADKDGTIPGLWNELGEAYVGAGNYAAAIKALQKQAELDPHYKAVYDDLGRALEHEKRADEALAAYQRQLENNPLDREASKRAGLLLAGLHRDDDARRDLERANAAPPFDPEVSLALAQLYGGASADKSAPLLRSLLGADDLKPSDDLFAAALQEKVDAGQTLRDARKVLDDIGDLFDSGAYEDDNDAAGVMTFVALEWARLGWANAQSGNVLEGLRYLRSAWLLSESGVVARRMAQVYRNAGQASEAQHMLSLAAVAPGPEQAASRAELEKEAPAGAERLISKAGAELAGLNLVKVASREKSAAAAEFALVFDGSDTPNSVRLRRGQHDAGAEDALLHAAFPVIFPDQSSIKIVRRGQLTCGAGGCLFAVAPLSGAQGAGGAVSAK